MADETWTVQLIQKRKLWSLMKIIKSYQERCMKMNAKITNQNSANMLFVNNSNS
jgi:hypothetical protein